LATSPTPPANKFLILAEGVDVAWCGNDNNGMCYSIMMIFFDQIQIKDNLYLYIFWHFNQQPIFAVTLKVNTQKMTRNHTIYLNTGLYRKPNRINDQP
jgi:hypothetical protein